MNTKKIKQTMSQMRAKYCLKESQSGDFDLELFNSYINSLPAMIRKNGLGQALAFYKMKIGKKEKKEEKVYNKIYEIISNWLCGNTCFKDENIHIFKNKKDALEAIVSVDMKNYMCAQSESLELLEWLKKFSKANKESNSGK